MELFYKVKKDCLVFYLKNDINLFVIDELRQEIAKIVEKEKINKIVFNFEAVEFLDSSGLALFLFLCSTNKTKKDYQIRLCCMNKKIYQMFEYTALNTYFKIDNSENESIEKLQTGGE